MSKPTTNSKQSTVDAIDKYILLSYLDAIPTKVLDTDVKRSEPDMETEAYLDYVVRRSKACGDTLIAAAVYLKRLHAKHPRVSAGQGGKCRLLSAAIMVAHKVLYDEVYTNSSWVKICGGFVPLPELNAMEIELLLLLDYDMTVGDTLIAAVRERATQSLCASIWAEDLGLTSRSVAGCDDESDGESRDKAAPLSDNSSRTRSGAWATSRRRSSSRWSRKTSLNSHRSSRNVSRSTVVSSVSSATGGAESDNACTTTSTMTTTHNTRNTRNTRNNSSSNSNNGNNGNSGRSSNTSGSSARSIANMYNELYGRYHVRAVSSGDVSDSSDTSSTTTTSTSTSTSISNTNSINTEDMELTPPGVIRSISSESPVVMEMSSASSVSSPSTTAAALLHSHSTGSCSVTGTRGGSCSRCARRRRRALQQQQQQRQQEIPELESVDIMDAFESSLSTVPECDVPATSPNHSTSVFTNSVRRLSASLPRIRRRSSSSRVTDVGSLSFINSTNNSNSNSNSTTGNSNGNNNSNNTTSVDVVEYEEVLECDALAAIAGIAAPIAERTTATSTTTAARRRRRRRFSDFADWAPTLSSSPKLSAITMAH